eukprot:CAMPEP_0204873778 /NCGR_PEP_ID=MMETSP1348-20121228/41554_1 /ASSEMBLY_ACC=CAM_ASM_000700 /TAXON_ID=215587 /ORGANISM="Aplanochytrium stocchinoi, Strain GSBS06" /LENGTH=269 /DNA_ID=CAMNT_0052029273 /DNA_START=13 /DNA_END=822 /DNA_ORIENTATION=-
MAISSSESTLIPADLCQLEVLLNARNVDLTSTHVGQTGEEIDSVGFCGLIHYVRLRGICNTPNIFRESRSLINGRKALKDVKRSRKPEQLRAKLQSYDIHDLALALKLYFKEEQEAFPLSMFNQIVSCCSGPQENLNVVASRLEGLFENLSQQSKLELRLFFKLLKDVKTSEISLLAYTFGPTLVRPEARLETFDNMLTYGKIVVRITETMIAHGDTLFANSSERASLIQTTTESLAKVSNKPRQAPSAPPMPSSLSSLAGQSYMVMHS